MKRNDHYRELLAVTHRIGRLMNPQHLPGLRGRQLSMSQFLVLDVLESSGVSLRMSELAERSGLKAAELTRVVTVLEARSWLHRTPDAEDSRVKQVKLTAAGTRVIRRAQQEATTELGAVWDDLTHDEWHRLIDLLQRFERGIRRVRVAGPAARRE